ncbi:MAG: ATP-binding protein [Planctomycetes bacterium]|nr:ATP-binding protein [Planctomycetota bacterium]
MVTGPRQAGKTSLIRRLFPDLRYFTLDVAEDREFLAGLRTRSFAAAVGTAILDEAQKEPTLFEKVKFAFDERQINFAVLLGSAHILLLRKVSETLAGRALRYELWPLTAGELAGRSGDSPISPLLSALTTPGARVDEVLAAEPAGLSSQEEEPLATALEHLAEFGGMPGLLSMPAERRGDWIASYVHSYLERDLVDLVRLSDLQPFRTFQRLAAQRVARLISFSDLARDAGISPTTAKNYVEYLRISFQAFLLEPWHENLTSRLVKTPKLYFSDLGILRHLAGHRGPLNGPLFENLVVAEVVKWLGMSGSDTRPFFYRTRSGMEIDLLLENGDGLLALEVKNREDADWSDARALRAFADAAGERWRGGIVATRGRRIERIDEARRIFAVPVRRLLC